MNVSRQQMAAGVDAEEDTKWHLLRGGTHEGIPTDPGGDGNHYCSSSGIYNEYRASSNSIGNSPAFIRDRRRCLSTSSRENDSKTNPSTNSFDDVTNGTQRSSQDTSVVAASSFSQPAWYRLLRLDKPIGTWLLAWPCAWSIGMATSESLTMAKESVVTSQHISSSALSMIASLHLPSFEWYASVPDIERMAIVMALFGTGAVVRAKSYIRTLYYTTDK